VSVQSGLSLLTAKESLLQILLQKSVTLAEGMELEPVLVARVLARVPTGKARVLFARVQVQKNAIRAKAQDNNSPNSFGALRERFKNPPYLATRRHTGQKQTPVDVPVLCENM
jgi:predicted membrane metal-binding protein